MSVEISQSLNSQNIISLGQTLGWSENLTKQLLSDLPKILNNESSINAIHNYANHQALNQLHEYLKSNLTLPDTFQLFCIIATIPKTIQEYENKKIPLKYFYNIMNDLQIWVNDFYKKYHRIGFDKINWVTNHLTLKIFQFGSFQYEPKVFNKPFQIYLNKKSKEILCLATKELSCNKEGLIIDESQSDAIHFATSFIEDKLQFSGHLVNKKGYIQAKKSRHLHQDWELIANPSGNYIAFHIPEGSKLTIENLNNSFLEANLFFAKYFPEFKFQIYGTDSWIFDDQIAEYLPESNIAKFQQCVHLLPIKNGNDEQFKERVFGDPKVDIKEIEPTTQLQKIGIAHINAGKEWRKKSFVLNKDNLPLRPN